ncbi:acyltransferase family protein [Blastococcus sp. TF02A-26]|uniref:acyltransferase family protein n=1 Tax=Blastococcus sp. TF02A-26 TaxID=2250577 RepID=UPI001314A1E0|nr:acyltransferase family protein [Blastococcus sp. TF02A-26]
MFANTHSDGHVTGLSRADVLPADGSDHFRADIEGLRAVAVVLVVADHLTGWPAGGFIGVDVFFVLSGFLITGLLLREHERTGRISFADFYRRRVRRIVPASLLVLGVTAGASWLLYFAARAQQVLGDVGWAVLFGANWRFAVQGTDYLAADGPTSPVQHYWSLAVEEQFYVVWPVLLALLLWVGRARNWSSRSRTATVAVVLVALTAGGLGYALWDTATRPSWAYFSTATRAWELGVGALVAVAAGRLARLSGRTRTPLAWLGLIAVLAGAFVVPEDDGFPAPWALLPVLGAALVVAAGTGSSAHGPAVLTNPVARYLGATSYSLYLWHFPVIVLGRALFPETGATYYAATLGITVLAAVASFHLVEQPIRRSNWLRPGGPAARRGRHRPPARAGVVRHGVAVLAVAALVAAALVTAATGGTWRWPGTMDPSPMPAATSLAAAPGETPEDTLAAGIDAALDAAEWPALRPGLEGLGPLAAPDEWMVDGCLDVTEANLAACTYGDAGPDRTAVLLGDSIALSWITGIRAALPGWEVVVMTYHACPAAVVPVVHVTSAATFPEECDAHHRWTMSEVERLRPALVIMSSVGNTVDRLRSGATGSAALQEWTQAQARTVDQLADLAGRVVVLADPPGGVRLLDCLTRFSSPSDCDSTASGDHVRRVELESAAVAALGRPVSAVEYVQTRRWFCSADERCPSFVGTTPVYADGFHMTSAYSRGLAPVLREVLVPTS